MADPTLAEVFQELEVALRELAEEYRKWKIDYERLKEEENARLS